MGFLLIGALLGAAGCARPPGVAVEQGCASVRSGNTLTNAPGLIEVIDYTSSPAYLFRLACDSSAYLVTSDFSGEGGTLPEAFRRDGLRVVVSGEILEPPANVRLPAAPLRITSVREAEGVR